MTTPAAADAKVKAGIWTEHVDPSSGRKYYFNMVQNRSYWTLPSDVLAQVHRPVIEVLREWDPQAAEAYESESSTKTEDERLHRKRREELVAAAIAAEGNAGSANMAALQERMALAAQRQLEEAKIRTAATAQQKLTEGQTEGESNNAYLKMVRALQSKDRDTESSGGKWLVR